MYSVLTKIVVVIVEWIFTVRRGVSRHRDPSYDVDTHFLANLQET